MKGIQKNGIASKGLVVPSEDRKEGEEIPVFISHGVKTINDLIQNLGLDNLINAEFLRKIKFGEESSSERELVRIFLFLSCSILFVFFSLAGESC
jgi:hypothetical protein